MLDYPSISMAEIKRLYGGGEYRHWFDPETLAFFQTKLPGSGVRTNHGNYFITSETNPSGVTAFSIRRQHPETGGIETVGKFHEHPTYRAARDALGSHLVAIRLGEAVA